MKYVKLLFLLLTLASNIANAQIDCAIGNHNDTKGHEEFIENGIKYRIDVHEEKDIITMETISHTCAIYVTRKDGGYSGDITIPATTSKGKVKGIGGTAFSGSTELTSVIVSDGIEEIGLNAFSNCTALKEIYLPASVTEITSGSFVSGCTALEKVSIGFNFGKIFKNLPALKEIILNKGVTEITEEAFYSCSKLEKVEIVGSTRLVHPIKAFWPMEFMEPTISTFSNLLQL